VALRLRVDLSAMARTRQLVGAAIALVLIEQGVIRVQLVDHAVVLVVLVSLAQQVIHLRVYSVKMVEIDFFAPFELDALENFEVDQLEFLESDERALAEVEHLLARLVDDALGEAHEGAPKFFCALSRYQVLPATQNVEQEHPVLIQTLE